MRREWIEIVYSGNKYINDLSPSMRREWIEMPNSCKHNQHCVRLPPCGGSGLKYDMLKQRVAAIGLPPCGGSGLK